MASQLITTGVSFLIGLLLGWLAALAVTAAARALGCLVVIVFVLIQLLGYYGIIDWNWTFIIDQLRPWAGMATEQLESGVNIMTYNLAMSVGFLAGLLLGIRR